MHFHTHRSSLWNTANLSSAVLYKKAVLLSARCLWIQPEQCRTILSADSASKERQLPERCLTLGGNCAVLPQIGFRAAGEENILKSTRLLLPKRCSIGPTRHSIPVCLPGGWAKSCSKNAPRMPGRSVTNVSPEKSPLKILSAGSSMVIDVIARAKTYSP